MSLTLVTGVPGSLGTRFLHSLIYGLPDLPPGVMPVRNRRIRCLVKPGTTMLPLRAMVDKIEILEGDLRNADAVRAFCKNAAGATLFHCAGVIHPTRGVREFFDTNVEGTRRLLQAAEEAHVRRVVVVSSNSPMGANPHRSHLFDEGSPYHPYMGYGRSKMLMELVVQEYQARGKLETVIIRPPWFYGPDQPPRQTSFFRMIKNGTVPIIGGGENRRSMVYVDNLCYALLLAERVQQANGNIYWVADLRPYTMNEIVDTVEWLMEVEFRIPVSHRRVRLPHLFGEGATIVDQLTQRFGIYLQRIHVLSEMNKTIACSIAKAQRELEYEPLIELQEGMRRSLAWLIDNGHLR